MTHDDDDDEEGQLPKANSGQEGCALWRPSSAPCSLDSAFTAAKVMVMSYAECKFVRACQSTLGGNFLHSLHTM